MRFLGAKVVVTPAAGRGVGMVNKAVELAKAHGWFLTRQFENEANPDIHSRTTAREIIEDFKGEKLDYWVTGYGTGGTLKGVSRVLAKEMPNTKIIVCEPEDAQLLTSGVAQERNPDGSAAMPHPAFKPHPMQGWTPDFIPKLTGDVVDMKVIDRIIRIAGPDALKSSMELAQKEGIFVGITAGASFAGALKVAADAPKGSTILCMLPDTGERYLSTPLFTSILGRHVVGRDGDLAFDAERAVPRRLSGRRGRERCNAAAPRKFDPFARLIRIRDGDAAMIDDPAGRIDYAESGSGPTVVLVPGSCSTGAAWRPMMAQWGDRFRYVTTSLLGYGGTAERRTIDDPSIDHEIDALDAVIRRAGGPVHLVGHSYGGMVSLAAALRKRVRDRQPDDHRGAGRGVAARMRRGCCTTPASAA